LNRLAQAYAGVIPQRRRPCWQSRGLYGSAAPGGAYVERAAAREVPGDRKPVDPAAADIRNRDIYGYSALCLAAGLAEDGRLHTIELRKEDADLAEGNFRRANWQDRIILHRGNALAIIPTLQEQWDLVFIDADKNRLYRLL